MILVSPNRVAQVVKCQANAGYGYVQLRKGRVSKALALGQARGSAIHAATFGAPEVPETTETPDDDYAGERGWALGHAAPTGDQWQLDARILWAFITRLWPGQTWHREQTLTTQLTPNIRLQGRLDLWGASSEILILDLKTSTGFHTQEMDGRALNMSLQLNLYARLVLDTTGKVPACYQIGYNPKTKVPHRRHFPISAASIAAASRLAVHAACTLERLSTQEPIEWQRSFQCETPYPCKHREQCQRDLGAHYSDGRGAPDATPVTGNFYVPITL